MTKTEFLADYIELHRKFTDRFCEEIENTSDITFTLEMERYTSCFEKTVDDMLANKISLEEVLRRYHDYTQIMNIYISTPPLEETQNLG